MFLVHVLTSSRTRDNWNCGYLPLLCRTLSLVLLELDEVSFFQIFRWSMAPNLASSCSSQPGRFVHYSFRSLLLSTPVDLSHQHKHQAHLAPHTFRGQMTQHQIVLLGQFWGQAMPEDLHCHLCRCLFRLYLCHQHTSFEESKKTIYPCTPHVEQKAMSQIAVRPIRYHHCLFGLYRPNRL